MPALQGDARADLAIVGGGFAGLWAALEALERDPGREVVLLEGGVVGIGASGRNGGFCAATLTHGHENRVCQRSRCPCVTLRRPSAVLGRPPHGGRLLGEIDAR
jgi:glycine/D-amino acid oxidase-like deaminating enzyme